MRVLKHFFFEKNLSSISLSLFILSLLLSCFFSLLVFSLLFSSLLSSLIFSCLVFHLLSSLCILISSFIFCPVSSSSCGLFFHLFTCLASSLVFSRLSSHMSLSVSLCVSLTVLCGVCGVPVCTFKNTSVCTGTTPACDNTCGRGAGTHGDVSNVHKGTFRMNTRRRKGRGKSGSSPVLLTKICPRKVVS